MRDSKVQNPACLIIFDFQKMSMRPSRLFLLKLILPLIVLALLSSSCGVQKYLRDEDCLLGRNQIQIDQVDQKKIRNKIENELGLGIVEKPNRKFLFFFRPGIWFHYRLQDPGDTTKFKKWQKENLARVPVFYSQEYVENIRTDLRNRMNRLGYFQSEISYSVNQKGRNCDLDFTVIPGELRLVDTLLYASQDSSILRLLEQNRKRSYLKKGVAINEENYNLEANRIFQQLRNQGYAYFVKSYISPMQVDTGNRVLLEIYLPENQNLHTQYFIRQVRLWPESILNLGKRQVIDSFYRDIHFMNFRKRMDIKPNVLADRIDIKPGNLFRQRDFDETILKINLLPKYRFVNVKFDVDSLFKDQIHVDMYLNPAKKQSIGFQPEVYYGDRSNFNNSIGVSLALNYRNKNLFRNSTQLNVSTQGGLEINLQKNVEAGNRIPVSNVSNQVSFEFPRYLGLFSNTLFWSWFLPPNQDEFQRKEEVRNLKKKSITRLIINYNNQRFPNFLNYDQFTFSINHEITFQKNKILNITNTNFNFFLPEIGPNLKVILDQNIALRNSLQPQVFSGFFFREFAYNFKSDINRFNESDALRSGIELSGLEIFAIERIYNLAGGKDLNLKLNQFEFAKFVRLDFERRYNRGFQNGTQIALRAGVGIAFPYGESTSVPYIKQFSAGGPNSVRAWQIRQLGPGAVTPPANNSTQFYFETGDIRLDMNLEYRFNLIWLVKMAVFLDAGNVWLLRDAERPEARFSSQFFKQIALGTGAGIRLDYSYFTIRFDLGYKLYSPYVKDGVNWVGLYPGKVKQLFNPNLAIGLPF